MSVAFGPYEEAPRVWGVGRLVIDGEAIPWPVSQRDVDDEAESQAPRLAALGVGAGEVVLIVSLLSQAVHVVPLEKATNKLGALYSSADATSADAFRVAALVRQLEPAAVLGLTGAALEGLAALEEPVAVLGTVPTLVTADDEAHAALTSAGLSPRRWVKLGPTSAWEETPGTLVYDPSRWEVEQDDEGGQLVVTNLVARLTPAARLATGVRGRRVAPGVIVPA